MAKEKETEVVDEIKEETKPAVEYENKISLKDRILKHKKKIAVVGGVGLGAFLLGKLFNHGRRLDVLEDYCLNDDDVVEDYDTDGDDDEIETGEI